MRLCFSVALFLAVMTTPSMLTRALAIVARPSFASSRKGTSRLAQQQNDNMSEEETQDERINRLLRKRIQELDMASNENDATLPIENEQPPSFIPFEIGSLELLALVVSVFFVATVSWSNGAIFAPPPATTTRERILLDADEILKQDFARDSSSVVF